MRQHHFTLPCDVTCNKIQKHRERVTDQSAALHDGARDAAHLGVVVADPDRGASARPHRRLDEQRRRVVERARRLVEEENVGREDEEDAEVASLRLPARQLRPRLRHHARRQADGLDGARARCAARRTRPPATRSPRAAPPGPPQPTINAHWESHVLCVLEPSWSLYLMVLEEVCRVHSD